MTAQINPLTSPPRHEMTFEQAMLHSIKLELDAWEGLALHLIDAKERLSRFVDFNPYMYAAASAVDAEAK